MLDDSWIYFCLGEESTENDFGHHMHLSVDNGKHVLPSFYTSLAVQKLHIILRFRDTHFTHLSSSFLGSTTSCCSLQLKADENQLVSACSSAGWGKSQQLQHMLIMYAAL